MIVKLPGDSSPHCLWRQATLCFLTPKGGAARSFAQEPPRICAAFLPPLQQLLDLSHLIFQLLYLLQEILELLVFYAFDTERYHEPCLLKTPLPDLLYMTTCH
jgi:hypothetical protein